MPTRRIHPLAARIKRVMQSDSDVGKIAQTTPIAISNAVKILLKELIQGGSQLAEQEDSKTLSLSHLQRLANTKLKELSFLTVLQQTFLPTDTGTGSTGTKRKRKHSENLDQGQEQFSTLPKRKRKVGQQQSQTTTGKGGIVLPAPVPLDTILPQFNNIEKSRTTWRQYSEQSQAEIASQFGYIPLHQFQQDTTKQQQLQQDSIANQPLVTQFYQGLQEAERKETSDPDAQQMQNQYLSSYSSSQLFPTPFQQFQSLMQQQQQQQPIKGGGVLMPPLPPYVPSSQPNYVQQLLEKLSKSEPQQTPNSPSLSSGLDQQLIHELQNHLIAQSSLPQLSELLKSLSTSMKQQQVQQLVSSGIARQPHQFSQLVKQDETYLQQNFVQQIIPPFFNLFSQIPPIASSPQTFKLPQLPQPKPLDIQQPIAPQFIFSTQQDVSMEGQDQGQEYEEQGQRYYEDKYNKDRFMKLAHNHIGNQEELRDNQQEINEEQAFCVAQEDDVIQDQEGGFDQICNQADRQAGKALVAQQINEAEQRYSIQAVGGDMDVDKINVTNQTQRDGIGEFKCMSGSFDGRDWHTSQIDDKKQQCGTSSEFQTVQQGQCVDETYNSKDTSVEIRQSSLNMHHQAKSTDQLQETRPPDRLHEFTKFVPVKSQALMHKKTPNETNDSNFQPQKQYDSFRKGRTAVDMEGDMKAKVNPIQKEDQMKDIIIQNQVPAFDGTQQFVKNDQSNIDKTQEICLNQVNVAQQPFTYDHKDLYQTIESAGLPNQFDEKVESYTSQGTNQKLSEIVQAMENISQQRQKLESDLQAINEMNLCVADRVDEQADLQMQINTKSEEQRQQHVCDVEQFRDLYHYEDDYDDL